jgi:hypothetical protein
VSADSSTSPAAGSTAATPGRSITSTPAKPTISADQRRTRTTSLSTSAASMVANKGVVKLSAVASASGSSTTEKNMQIDETTRNAERVSSRPERRVPRPRQPTRMSHGANIITARKLRQKEMTNTSTSADRWRTMPTSAAKHTALRHIHRPTRTATGRGWVPGARGASLTSPRRPAGCRVLDDYWG